MRVVESIPLVGFVREYRRGEHTYFAEVETYRDDRGKVRQRTLRYLGKSPTGKPEPVPLEGIEFADIAARLMAGTLTPDDVFSLLQHVGTPVKVSDLEAIGVRFEFALKKLELFLYPATSGSRPPRHARRASDPSASRRRGGARGS